MALAAWHFSKTTKLAGILIDGLKVMLCVSVIFIVTDLQDIIYTF